MNLIPEIREAVGCLTERDGEDYLEGTESVCISDLPVLFYIFRLYVTIK